MISTELTIHAIDSATDALQSTIGKLSNGEIEMLKESEERLSKLIQEMEAKQ